MTTDLALAIALALTSALLFATSNVVEQRIAARAPEEESLRPQLLVTLARQPVWLAGFAADVGGYGTQAAAWPSARSSSSPHSAPWGSCSRCCSTPP